MVFLKKQGLFVEIIDGELFTYKRDGDKDFPDFESLEVVDVVDSEMFEAILDRLDITKNELFEVVSVKEKK